MSLPPRRLFSTGRTTRQRYTDRIQAVADGPGTFNILIDGQLRFRLEGESQWPAQWRLYAITDGARAAQCLAIENEYWDIVSQLECGAHWMPIENIRSVTRKAPADSTYARWPEYLRER
ncbi:MULTISPECIES: hypothetical protein [Paraburkholderia]|uniref:hypothetical protein n=1 Tax=Paraburkholderia TaxID=1822464 RepID=UPI002257035B|nr:MULTISPECIES: hypothetical protein [Paraburkholderia]MCX4177444.1 hypothetical protein [Paraburkholderia madseniana]MDQ6465433.1 hypothetical protein [Paraburkholderia madseniana]